MLTHASDGKDLSWEVASKQGMKDEKRLARPGVSVGVMQGKGMTCTKARRQRAWKHSSGHWESKRKQLSLGCFLTPTNSPTLSVQFDSETNYSELALTPQLKAPIQMPLTKSQITHTSD